MQPAAIFFLLFLFKTGSEPYFACVTTDTCLFICAEMFVFCDFFDLCFYFIECLRLDFFQSSLFCVSELASDRSGLSGSDISARLGRNFNNWCMHPKNDRSCVSVLGASSFKMASRLGFVGDTPFGVTQRWILAILFLLLRIRILVTLLLDFLHFAF